MACILGHLADTDVTAVLAAARESCKGTAMVTGMVVVVDGLSMTVVKVCRSWCKVLGPQGETWTVRREMLQAWR